MILELNEQEAQVLVNMIDEAVKVKGLLVAEAANYFFRKIKEGIEKDKIKEEPLKVAS